ncbi:transcriptional regulator family: Fungal Specific TF [Aspergillus niger]|nr:transcriptional regulator family: Fungal Specific TF [Aspergillus niger]KAI2831769.1 transcriptional regulator family: Fungal Specific TF [Aspergillus niger]KAI2840458.1 transcriptional regulator family: Fungal Specific TF [Aspergillus niger]KAI2842244.1 transcriptional regulator family: Fungal Specific TF [Aspergillus niger]KAI2879098.1 transcriptional regulator family: Fungal Specific TF [Aspergillus niger]
MIGKLHLRVLNVGRANRHVTALQLNHESPHLSFVTQEIRRRAAWTMALLDGYFSVGLPGYSTINYEEIYQQYPCREDEFGSRDSDTIEGPSTARGEDKAHSSMLELILRISRVRRDIMRFTRQLALLEQPLEEFQGIVQGFQMNLAQLQEKIASVVGSSATGSMIRPNFRWVVRALEIQIAWRQAHCDLFRLFLLGHPNAAPDVVLRPLGSSTYASQAQAICQEHSGWIVETISQVRNSDLQVLFSFDIARCAYQAARLNLFLAHMPNARSQLTSDSAVSNAAACLAFIKEKFASSAHAQRMISDLSLLIGAYETRDGHFGAAMALDSLRFSGDALEKHKQLSAHSLIHQANFVDDSYLYEL